MSVHHRVRAQRKLRNCTSVVCHSSVQHTGTTPSRQGRYRSTCEESQRIFPGLSVIKQRTAVTVVGGGTSTAGPWDGEPNNSGKNNESLEREPCDFLTKCKYAK